jgi:hypothetical protein
MTTKKKDPTQVYSRIFEEFAGSYVTIAIKSLKGYSTNKKIANVMMAGFLLDECENFYYIGETAKEIFAAIKKEEVLTVMLGGEAEEVDIEMPEGAEMQ